MHNSSTTTTLQRLYGRKFNELRPIRITYDVFGYASASVLFEIGNTKVLCAVSLQSNVPPFLKGTKTGWLKAEYSMLPTATEYRTQRESSSVERNGRSVEISRLIGRSLRTIVNLEALGEKTIVVDCDVLQADGGTRSACITGASLAIHAAVERWMKAGILHHDIMLGHVGAISAGIVNGQVLLDIDYTEDSKIDADFNFVLTKAGAIIEIQGTSEKKTISWDDFEKIRVTALHGIEALFTQCEQRTNDRILINRNESLAKTDHRTTGSLFSLSNRLPSSN